MKMTRQILTLLAMVLTLAACEGGSGVVEGIVFEAQREQAIEGAVVTIVSLEGDDEEQFVLTDINGLYRFEDVPEGLNNVIVVKEGYAAGGTTKLADVVEQETLTLDFRLALFARRVIQNTIVRIVDQNGPVVGATVDLYVGFPRCIGKFTPCVPSVEEGQQQYVFSQVSLISDAAGFVAVPFAGVGGFAIEEFNEYLFQLRVTAPGHQNVVREFRFTIDNLPDTLDLFLPLL